MTTLRRSPLFHILAGMAIGSLFLLSLVPGLAIGAPLVAITKPPQGAVVSGQIWIDVAFSATNNLPVTRLEVYIDDQLAREVDLAQPLLVGRQSFNWDFSYASNTVHKISARAIDAGNNAAMASITVQVQNATTSGPDVIPPVVRIYYPAQGARVSGRTEIKAEATDNVGVEVVYFYIDGRLHKMMMNTPPYVAAWDTTKETDGPHVLEAVAVDRAENEARSAQVTVIVENRSMTTMPAGGAGSLLAQGLNGGVSPSPLPTATAAPATQPLPETTAAPAPIPAPAPSPVAVAEPLGAPAASLQTKPTGASEAAAATASEKAGTVAMAPEISRLPQPAQRPVSGSSGTAGKPAAAGDEKANATAAPRIVNVVPWAPLPSYPAPAPTITLPSISSSAPLAGLQERVASLPVSTRITPATPIRSEEPSLGRPSIPAKLPTDIPAARGVAKSATLAEKPDVLKGASAVAAPRSAALSAAPPVATGLAPAPAPKTSALQTTQPVAETGKRQSGLGLLAERPVPSSSPIEKSNVTPIGLPTATPSSKPIEIRPALTLAPESKAMPHSGLARVTPPQSVAATTPMKTTELKAPQSERTEKLALGIQPPAAKLITDAVIAEYKARPVPAARMYARLPEPRAPQMPSGGRITQPDKPQEAIAAVPVAIHKIRDIKIVFDGEVLSLRAAPETRRGISLAPLREIFEKTDGVLYWFPVEKKVHAVNKTVDMKLRIGDPKVRVNGEERVLEIAPYIKQGRTMLPLQFIADVLDVSITVNSATGQIIISSNQM